MTRVAVVLGIALASGCGAGARIVDAGAGPLRVLRYAPAAGARSLSVARWQLRAGGRTTGAVGTRVIPEEGVPLVRFDATTQVQAVHAGGGARVDRAVSRVELAVSVFGDPAGTSYLDELRQTVLRLDGRRDAITRGSDGAESARRAGGARPGDDAIEAPLPFDEAWLVTAVEPPILPSAPVGIGAVWETRRTVVRSGVAMREVATWRLVDLDGDRGTVALEATYSASPQRLAWREKRARLTALSGALRGDVRFDLGAAAPRAARLDLALSIDVRLDGEEWIREMGFVIRGQGVAGAGEAGGAMRAGAR